MNVRRFQAQAERLWEAHYPTAFGGAALMAALVWGPALFKLARAQSWHVDQLYTGVFTVATVVTGVLFTFYTFLATSDRGFLGRAKKTIFYKVAVGYFVSAMISGGLTIAVSLPFLIVQPAPESRDLELLVVAGWSALATFALAAAERAARLFAIFTRQAD